MNEDRQYEQQRGRQNRDDERWAEQGGPDHRQGYTGGIGSGQGGPYQQHQQDHRGAWSPQDYERTQQRMGQYGQPGGQYGQQPQFDQTRQSYAAQQGYGQHGWGQGGVSGREGSQSGYGQSGYR